jgi:hypothetical protein
MGLGSGGKRGDLLMTQTNPPNVLPGANRICDSIEGIAGDPINSLNSCVQQNIYYKLSHFL